MEIATVERLFPGRAVIGFGHGVQEWMGQVGARPDSPVTLLREYLTALRRLVAGEEVTTSGRYINLDHVQLAWPPATTPTVLAGAIGPKSLAVCAEAADGIILTGFAGLAGIRRTRDMVGDRPVTAYVRAAIGKDAQARIDAEDTEELSATNDNIPAMIQQLSEAGANTVVLVPTPDEPDIEGLIRYAAGLS
jgi:alkanesulfonate monooxygenase SsuD/methylene tetrahydromethanopterin reductase-like flavin-dependent oxidoreductase (luciferase family)